MIVFDCLILSYPILYCNIILSFSIPYILYYIELNMTYPINSSETNGCS